MQNPYSKVITFEQYLPEHDIWVRQTLRTTSDAIWLHLQRLNMKKDVKQIVVKDVDTAITLAVQ
jgi:hypothetical protein